MRPTGRRRERACECTYARSDRTACADLRCYEARESFLRCPLQTDCGLLRTRGRLPQLYTELVRERRRAAPGAAARARDARGASGLAPLRLPHSAHRCASRLSRAEASPTRARHAFARPSLVPGGARLARTHITTKGCACASHSSLFMYGHAKARPMSGGFSQFLRFLSDIHQTPVVSAHVALVGRWLVAKGRQSHGPRPGAAARAQRCRS